MQSRLCLWRVLFCVGALFSATFTFAEEVDEEYRCELGLQVGGGYYVGDVHKHIFMEPLDAPKHPKTRVATIDSTTFLTISISFK